MIINAIEATLVKSTSDRRIDVATARKDSAVEVTVSDSGPGIPSDKLAGIFDPFSSTKPNGMGMGLSIARTIVEAHEGSISVENRKEGGAMFRVSLPLSYS